MKKPNLMNDDQRWLAVLARDGHADGQFVFAVQTTGIFCRPSCRARHALRENVRFYPDARQAVQAGFRPCKRCRPDQPDPQAQRIATIEKACRLLEQEQPLTLERLAQEVAMSPWHLHRLFKSFTGMTPKAWQQAARAKRLRDALAQGESITDSVLAAGFPDSSSYYRNADATLGMTAKQYRSGGEETTVHYALSNCTLGRRPLNIPVVRWLCRWIFAAPPFSVRSGRPCALYVAERRQAISRWPTPLVIPVRCGRWPGPAPPTSWRLLFPVTGWYGATAGCRATAGVRLVKRHCCVAKPKKRRCDARFVCRC